MTEWHRAADAKMADFAGWDMPLEYPDGVLAEHRAVREGCGLFDVSHMGEIHLRGDEAIAAADRRLSNSLAALSVGQVQYTLMCNAEGGVIDDMLASRLSADEILLVPNASNTARVLQELRAVVPASGMVDASTATAMLAVQGPGSLEVLSGMGFPVDHDYMHLALGDWAGEPVILSRTGYTGEPGVELIVSSNVAPGLWRELVAAGAKPCGLGARDTLRTEMGYPLHGQDLTETITAVEAGLSWAVAWDKDAFVGDAALRAAREAGPERRLRGIELVDRGVLRPGMAVLRDDATPEAVGSTNQIGVTTSGTFSPSLGRGVGLALLDADVGLDQHVVVAVRNRRLKAVTRRPPFVDSSPR